MASPTSTTRSLALVLLASGCVATPVDRTTRFAGPIAPCAVAVDGEAVGVAPAREPSAELYRPGPWAPWNTHPGPGCNENPTIELAAERTVLAVSGQTAPLQYRNLQMYVTYPTDADPSFTGVAPVADGRFGVVIFAHANHDYPCQIFESYYSLQDAWASWGFVVAAVDGTAFNCDAGTAQNVDLRAQTMVAAMRRLRELDADPHSRFYGHLDLDHIVVAGHSRGGGASFGAAEDVDAAGIIALQSVDPAVYGMRSAHLTTLPVLAISAGKDVDLEYPRVDPIEDRLDGPYTWVNINGGIHAYTADTVPLEFDDRPGITRQNQHDLTALYTTAFLRDVMGIERHNDILRDLDGVRRASGISARGVYQRWRADVPTVWVDRFDRATPDLNELGGTTHSEGFLRAEEVHTYRPDDADASGRWAQPTSLLLSSVGHATYQTQLDADGPLDVAQTPQLMFRAKGPDFGAVAALTIVFVRADGEDAVAIGPDQRGALPLSNRFQQVVVPVPSPDEPLLALKLETFGGAILLDDLRFVSD